MCARGQRFPGRGSTRYPQIQETRLEAVNVGGIRRPADAEFRRRPALLLSSVLLPAYQAATRRFVARAAGAAYFSEQGVRTARQPSTFLSTGTGENARASMEADHLITGLLAQVRDGDPEALERLMPLVYEEMRHVAQRQLRGQRDGHTLSTTALVHEAYLKLVDQTRVAWTDRAHFFGVAARAMRQVLTNHAHRRAASKRGGQRRIALDEAVLAVDEQAELLLALDEALTRLSALNERLSRVVEYRFFGGMTEDEVATALGISERTVRRDWLKAKLWLYTELSEDVTG
jgi:RNA polymerase sigma factor (TIGR02999 family)